LKVLIDENLPPAWSDFLENHVCQARHWTEVGQPGASDETVWKYALENNLVILSQDLDFSRMLALHGTTLPSVIQFRVDLPLPEACGEILIGVLRTHREQLFEGCLITIQEGSSRIRLLPLR